MPAETTHQAAVITEDLVRYERVKKKGITVMPWLSLISVKGVTRINNSYLFSFIFFILGYVRLLTNFGALNLELHCDLVPKTCENFIKHCQNGYYDGTKFHRSIRNFMASILSTTTNAFRNLNCTSLLFSCFLFCFFFFISHNWNISFLFADPGRWSDQHGQRWQVYLG